MSKVLWISYSGFREPDNIMAPHGPTGVLTYLKSKNPQVEGIVCNLNDPFLYGYPENPHVPSQGELNRKLGELLDVHSPDILFATGWINDYIPLLKSMDFAKQHSKNIMTALGGPHPSWFPKMTLEKLPHILGRPDVDETIDFLIAGEGELASQMIIEYPKGRINKEDIPGAYWLERGQVKKSKHDSFRFQNLDSLPFSDWKDFMYFDHHWPIVQIDHNRGCSYNCVMCGHHPLTGSVIRQRGPEKVAEYIEKTFKEYGINHFRFSGSELDGKEAQAISQSIIDRGLEGKLFWSCFGRVNHLSSENLGMMKRAGCEIIFYGFESGNDQILGNITKQFNVEQIISQAKKTSEAGIKVVGSVMVGNPGETNETIEDTRRLIYRLSEKKWINTVPLMPMYILPCAPLGLSSQMQERYGYIMSENWEEQIFSTTARHMHNPDGYAKTDDFLYKTTSGVSFKDYTKKAGELCVDFQKNLGLTRASDAILLIADVIGQPIEKVLERYYSSRRELPGDSLQILCDDITAANSKRYA